MVAMKLAALEAVRRLDAARDAVAGKRFRLCWAMTVTGTCTLTHFDQFGEPRYLFTPEERAACREVGSCVLGRDVEETTI